MADSPDRKNRGPTGRGADSGSVGEPRGRDRLSRRRGKRASILEQIGLDDDVFGGIEAQTLEMDPGHDLGLDEEVTVPHAATSSMSYGGIIGDRDDSDPEISGAARTWPPMVPQRSPDPTDLEHNPADARAGTIPLEMSLSDDEDATSPLSPLSNDPDNHATARLSGDPEQPARAVSLPNGPRRQTEAPGGGEPSVIRSPLPPDLESTLPQGPLRSAPTRDTSISRGINPWDQDEPTEEESLPREQTDENSAQVMGVVFDGESSYTPDPGGGAPAVSAAEQSFTPPPLPGLESSEELDAQLDGEVSQTVREGIRALRKGDRVVAIAQFERALRSDPDDAMAQAYLSLAHDLLVRHLLPGARKSSVPKLRVGREMLMTLDLDPSAGMVLSMVDGMMTLEEIETMLQHMDRETIYRHLAHAMEDGLVEIAS